MQLIIRPNAVFSKESTLELNNVIAMSIYFNHKMKITIAEITFYTTFDTIKV